MRMPLKVSIPVENGNRAVQEGTLGSTIERIRKHLKPEAAPGMKAAVAAYAKAASA